MKNYLLPSHTTGETQFIDDYPETTDILYGYLFGSPVARGMIRSLNLTAAKSCDGVVDIFTADDIPGHNELGDIIQDEPLLAEKRVGYIGQTIAFVVATSLDKARAAVAKIEVEFIELSPILEAREAFKKGMLLVPPKVVAAGDVDSSWAGCETIVQGKTASGEQEHLYLETQISVAYPQEQEKVKILAGTQSPSFLQKQVARVLGIGMHQVDVEVQRLGGAFGGKEVQATPIAALAALAATKLQRAVKVKLPRQVDMYMTGKRHSYSSDYKIGLDRDLKIIAYQATLYSRGGFSTDLTTSVMEASLLHAPNVYHISNFEVTGICTRNNLPPRTAFRSYGRPQGIFVIECAIDHAAEVLGVDKDLIQEKNLIKIGEKWPYGTVVKKPEARRSFVACKKQTEFEKVKQAVNTFNAKNRLLKKGVTLMPISFAVGFATTFLNQAGALVNIYFDGSVSVSTGAVEMGQSVYRKIHTIVAATLDIDPNLVNVHSTTTSRVANTSPTAASSGSELNGMAAQIACLTLKKRLLRHASRMLKTVEDFVSIKKGTVFLEDRKTDITWKQLIWDAYSQRINLTAKGHYATPALANSPKDCKSDIYAYRVWGCAMIEVLVDCLRGRYSVDNVHIVHDVGKSIDELIDRGQIEGAFIQGMGWNTMEEVVYNEKGLLTSDTLSSYKIPDIHSIPRKFTVHFLKNSTNPFAVMQSKGVGEPPFIYSLGIHFALLNAIKAFNCNTKRVYELPMTPEKVLNALYKDR